MRFWAGAPIEAARCDCLRAAACKHVALGVWAFRRAAAEAAAAPVASVRLGGDGVRHRIDRAPFDALVAALLRHGVARGPGVLTQALSNARAAAAGAAWLGLLLGAISIVFAAGALRSDVAAAAVKIEKLEQRADGQDAAAKQVTDRLARIETKLDLALERRKGE